MFMEETSGTALAQPQIAKRTRHTRANEYCGMKAILRELLKLIADQPMKVKDIAAEVCRRSNEANQDQNFSVKTIQKRLYDVCLVLKSIGYLHTFKKEVQLSIPSKKVVQKKKSLDYMQLSRQIKFRTESVKSKKNVLFKLHETLNLFRILKRQQSKPEHQSQKKIHIQDAFGVLISIKNIFFDVDNDRESMTLLLANPTKIYSNVDLLLKVF